MRIAEGGDEKIIYPTIPAGRTEEWTKLSVLANEGMTMEIPFKWWDFGTWESVDKYLSRKSESQKVESEMAIEIEAENNFVKTTDNKPVAIIDSSSFSDFLFSNG